MKKKIENKKNIEKFFEFNQMQFNRKKIYF